MKSAYIIIIIAVLVIGIGGYILTTSPEPENTGEGTDSQNGILPGDNEGNMGNEEQGEQMNENEEQGQEGNQEEENIQGEEMGEENVITYTDGGYTPATLTVSVGDTVTFKNASSRQTWPASAKHPTHTVYPGSNIQKCGTQEAESIFDACQGIAEGEEWSFTFNQAGTWKYHDHLNPTRTGTIVVE